MPTGDKLTNIFSKKLLSKTDLKDRLVDYFQNRIDDIVSSMFSGQAGVLDADQITVSVGAANNKFTLGLSQADRLVTADGSIITLPAGVAGLTQNVQFENTAAATYYIGARYANPVAQEVQLNERTGLPEYPALEESYGELGNPDSVTDDPGVAITLVVDGLLENGVNHSGQVVMVYLQTPVSGAVGTAFYDGVITYDGGSGENRIVIPYSGANGPLGQDTTVDPPSTTAADYVVHVKGASWFKNNDLRADTNYAFIAIATGGTPPTFDLADQIPVFQQSLDRAYDGQAGAGSGRQILLDAGAVRLRTIAGTGDTYAAMLELDKTSDTTGHEISQHLMGGRADDRLLLCSKVYESGVALTASEGVTFTDTDQITFLSGTIDLVAAGLMQGDLVKIASSPADDGLYIVFYDIQTDSCRLLNLDQSYPSFTVSDGGVVTVLRPVMGLGKDFFEDEVADVNFIGSNQTAAYDATVIFRPGGKSNSAMFMDSSGDPALILQADGSFWLFNNHDFTVTGGAAAFNFVSQFSIGQSPVVISTKINEPIGVRIKNLSSSHLTNSFEILDHTNAEQFVVDEDGNIYLGMGGASQRLWINSSGNLIKSSSLQMASAQDIILAANNDYPTGPGGNVEMTGDLIKGNLRAAVSDTLVVPIMLLGNSISSLANLVKLNSNGLGFDIPSGISGSGVIIGLPHNCIIQYIRFNMLAVAAHTGTFDLQLYYNDFTVGGTNNLVLQTGYTVGTTWTIKRLPSSGNATAHNIPRNSRFVHFYIENNTDQTLRVKEAVEVTLTYQKAFPWPSLA